MLPPKPRDDHPGDVEQVRRHTGRPALEHPVPRRPAALRPRTPAEDSTTRLSVMDWLLALGVVVTRSVPRLPPASPMVQLHPLR